MKVNLFFVNGLGIPNGEAFVPALVWKATRDSLSVFALKGKRKPDARTPLYHAPFFNIYPAGNVCMGTVDSVVSLSTISISPGGLQTWSNVMVVLAGKGIG